MQRTLFGQWICNKLKAGTMVLIAFFTSLSGYGSTLACPASQLKLSWTEFPPFILSDEQSIKGAFIDGLHSMIETCCPFGTQLNTDSKKPHIKDLEEGTLPSYHFLAPITKSYQMQHYDHLFSDWKYLPLIETPGRLIFFPTLLWLPSTPCNSRSCPSCPLFPLFATIKTIKRYSGVV